jgi:hypothetical protein
VLDILREELERTLMLMGLGAVSAIDRSSVSRADLGVPSRVLDGST